MSLRVSISISMMAALLLGPQAALARNGVTQINQVSIEAVGFPFVISTSGSYRLTSNLSVPNGSDGIEIRASDVDIDLNGFSIVGTPGSLNGINGRPPGITPLRVTVKNGFVRDMDGNGIDVLDESIIDAVDAVGNGGVGIRVGNRSIVRNSRSAINGGLGVEGGAGAVIENCRVAQNQGGGIDVTSHRGNVYSNAVVTNTGSGIVTRNDVAIRGNVASSNSVNGIDVLFQATIVGNAVSLNGNDGIQMEAGCTVTDNSVFANTGDGVQGTEDSLLMRNVIVDNSAMAANLPDNNALAFNVFDVLVDVQGEPGNTEIESNCCNGFPTCFLIP